MVRTVIHNRALIGFLTCVALLTSQAASTQSLSDCAAMTDDPSRLRCFDALAASASSAPAATPTVSGSTADAGSPPPTAGAPTVAGVSSYDDIFGLENQASTQGREEVQSPIANDFDGWSGRTIFRLENGQVWVQQDQNSKMTWRGDAHPMATIKRKSFNSYLLRVEGANKSVRVRRIE